MAMLILDRDTQKRLIASRKAWGADRFDEVWNGVYVMSPIANDEHQEIVGALTAAFLQAGLLEGSKVRPGVNVSDRDTHWKHNFRVPDVAVFLPDSKAVCKDAFWYGGPDFAVEIISKGDRARKKRAFYASVGTRELLVIDRYPWALELYRLQDGKLELVGRSTLEEPRILTSEVVPLGFRLLPGEPRPQIEATHADGTRRWTL